MNVVANSTPQRPLAAVLEQTWPRRTPRVLLGFDVLRRWLTHLLRNGSV